MFYTYIYLDPRKPGKYEYGSYKFDYEPIYVGKGKGNRDTSHYNMVKSYLKGNRKIKKINKFYAKLIKLIKVHEKPIILRLHDRITESESFDFEKQLIKLIGKESDGGLLLNICDGGEGSSGHTMSEQGREAMRKYMTGRSMPKDAEHRKKLSNSVKSYFDNNPEVKKHLSKKASERRWSTEWKENRSKQYTGDGNPFKGKTHSDEVKKLLKEKSRKYDWFIIDNEKEIKIEDLKGYCNELGIKVGKAYTSAHNNKPVKELNIQFKRKKINE